MTAKTTTILTMAASMLLAACGDKAPAPKPNQTGRNDTKPTVVAPTNGETRKLRDKPMTPEEVSAYQGSVEDAMAKIPPDLRVDFQKAFECQATKNAGLAPKDQIEMDGAWIVMKTAQLKADRTATTC
jgi:hypothetical protein